MSDLFLVGTIEHDMDWINPRITDKSTDWTGLDWEITISHGYGLDRIEKFLGSFKVFFDA